MERCTKDCRGIDYCADCNPLGGDYSEIRREQEADLAAGLIKPSRQRRIEHEGYYGHRYRRPRMDRRRGD